jgi:hypothetical protein
MVRSCAIYDTYGGLPFANRDDPSPPPQSSDGGRRSHPLTQTRQQQKQKQLTEAPIVLKCPMQAHDARMSRAKADESVFLRDRGIELVVALEVTFVEYFDCVLLSRCVVYAMHDLWSAACHQGGACEGAS